MDRAGFEHNKATQQVELDGFVRGQYGLGLDSFRPSRGDIRLGFETLVFFILGADFFEWVFTASV